jgi:hypothetical protein
VLLEDGVPITKSLYARLDNPAQLVWYRIPAARTHDPMTDRPFHIPFLVGVSGHRDLLPEQVPAIRAEVERLLRRLQAESGQVSLQLLCPMAEGADLLVAEVAQELGIEILAVLTFPREICRADLGSDQARAVFDRVLAKAEALEVPAPVEATLADLSGPSAFRELQFQRAALLVASYSTLLIAIWDGVPTPHLAGTARVLDFRRRGVSTPSEQAEFAPSDLLLSAHDNDLVYEIRCARSSTAAAGSVPPVAALGFLGGVVEATSDRNAIPQALQTLLRCTADFNRDVEKYAGQISREGRKLTIPSPYPVPPTLSLVDRLFMQADWLGGHFRHAFTRTLKIRYGLWAAMAFLLLAFKKMSTGYLGLATIISVLGIFGAGAILAAWAHRRAWHRKCLDYRALAEALRVDYYWEIAGVRRSFAGEFAHESFLQKQDIELEWIRAAMRVVSLRIALRPSKPSQAGFAHAYAAWIGDEDPVNGSGQLLYYSQRSRELHDKIHRYETIDRYLLLFGLLLAVTFAASIVLELNGLRFLAESPRNLLLWALALLTVYAAIFEIYLGEKADRSLVRQYRYMHWLFRLAANELKSPRRESDKLEILRSLGHACLAENAQWILAHRGKRIEGLKW